MATQIRLLIDYATGDNWELPLDLYEKYQKEYSGKKHFESGSETWIQYWITTLSLEEKIRVLKK